EDPLAGAVRKWANAGLKCDRHCRRQRVPQQNPDWKSNRPLQPADTAFMWQKACDLLLELVAPSRCAACGEASRTLFCPSCGEPTVLAEQRFLGLPLLAGGLYQPPLKQAIHRYKYGGCPELGRGLARLLAARIAALELRPEDAFVPVPLHPARLAQRGYDQAA